jgi:hypothetical protein
MSNNKYPLELIIKISNLILGENKTVAEMSTEYNVSRDTIRDWLEKKAYERKERVLRPRSELAKLRKLKNKVFIINYKGGKCNRCSETNIHTLCFHHINPSIKNETINNLLDCGIDNLIKEVDKCELLCCNCHMEHHYGDNIPDRYSRSKQILLDYKNTNGCEKCGYNNCNAALEFHHIDPKTKDVNLSNMRIRKDGFISDYIKEELDKCQVLCSNCHRDHHAPKEFYKENKEEILNVKMREYKKIDIDKVKRLVDKGLDLTEIGKKMNMNAGIVYNAIQSKAYKQKFSN